MPRIMSATMRIFSGEVGQSRSTAIAVCFFSAFNFFGSYAFLAPIFTYYFFLLPE